MRTALLFFPLAVLLAAPAGAGLFGARQLPPKWNDSRIQVDGADTDWDGGGVLEKNGLAVAAANDDQYLYVFVSAADRGSAAQLAGAFRQSFTLWLDAKGGRKRSYGIKLEPRGAIPAREPQPVSTASYTVTIVDEDGPLGSLESEGIAFMPGRGKKKNLFFEFKIPLAKIAGKAGGAVGLGFETSEIDASAMPGNAMSGGAKPGMGVANPGSMIGVPGGIGSGPGGTGAGMGGPGAAMGDGPGGRLTHLAPMPPEPISFWLRLKPASRP